jgi:3-oxoacyl-[acyl-carrier protein] reductase
MAVKSVAIVTGASQGIGRAAAMRLAHDFSAVVLVARNKDKLEETAAEIISKGAEPMVYDLDLREAQSAEIVIQGTLERFSRIDAILNIAGAVPQIDLFEMTDAQWEDGFDDAGLGRTESVERFCSVHLRQRSFRPQARIRGRRRDQRSDHLAC